jgi:hypothetical protein
MRVRVVGGVSDLRRDLEAIPAKAARGFTQAVRSNAKEGNRLARQFARERSGPHGKHYYKRISAEALSPMAWEYGPTGVPKTEFVGAGFQHGVNLDLPNSADIVGPKLAHDAGEVVDRLFW